jgi:hypothetical protein
MGIFNWLKSRFFSSDQNSQQRDMFGFCKSPYVHLACRCDKKKKFRRARPKDQKKFTGHVDTFIDSRLVYNESLVTESDLLYEEYIEWCRLNSIPLKQKHTFFREFVYVTRNKNVKPTDRNGRHCYSGLGLKNYRLETI